MRVLLVHNRYRQRGGEDAVFEAELDLLRAAGHEVSTYVAHNDEVSDSGRVGLLVDTIWNRERAREIRQTVRDRQIDVAHFHNTLPLISPAAYAAARSEGAAVVQTLHNYRLACPSALLFRDGAVCEKCLGKSIAWPAIRHACYRGSRPASAAVAAMLFVHRLRGTYRSDVDAYITLTEFARQKMSEASVPRERSHVVPNFLADDPSPGDFEARDGVLFVGRLNPEKGVRTLLEAFSDPSSDGPKLTIAGDGPLRDAVAQAASENPRIEWLGAVEREGVLGAMARASMLVFPSTWYEGFPMTIVEAFASGLPVVASEIGSLSSIVDDEVGATVMPGDAEALREAVLRLSGDEALRRELGETARSRFETEFSASAHLNGIESVYRTAIAHRNGESVEGLAAPQGLQPESMPADEAESEEPSSVSRNSR
ncbi:MAG: glycosyltransferase family 4 protein [Planctomycetota bacterium]